VTITDDNQALVDASDLVLLSVPPAMAAGLTIDASGKLVASVMAGVTTETIMALSGADRVVRAMSSPAAEHALPIRRGVQVLRLRVWIDCRFGRCSKLAVKRTSLAMNRSLTFSPQ